MNRVFVYGTLLSGEYNNGLLRDSSLLGKQDVQGLLMYDLGPFPACVKTDGNTVVRGEVWEVDENTFKRLDRLEGYPDFYNRVEVETQWGKAWVYINNQVSNKDVIESGDWKAHLRRRMQ